MKNTLITSALVAILGLAFVGAPITAQAQTTNTPSSTAPAKATKAKKVEYKGTITAIDASSVTVASKEKTLTLAITPATTYKVGKAAGTLADFAVGDAVTGSYTKDATTGALSAASLHKKATKAATTPAPATPAPATTTTPAAQ